MHLVEFDHHGDNTIITWPQSNPISSGDVARNGGHAKSYRATSSQV